MSINNEAGRRSSISESCKLGNSSRSAINVYKSSYFALRLIALTALVGLGTTLASLGGAHGWWSTRALSKWTPMGAKIGCGVSGGSLLLVAIAIRKRESKGKPPATQSKEQPLGKNKDGKYNFEKNKQYSFSHSNRNINYLAVFNERSQKWLYFPEKLANEAEIGYRILSREIGDRTFLYPTGDWGIPPRYLP